MDFQAAASAKGRHIAQSRDISWQDITCHPEVDPVSNFESYAGAKDDLKRRSSEVIDLPSGPGGCVHASCSGERGVFVCNDVSLTY